MNQIIKLSKKHASQLAQIDFESEHQGDREEDASKRALKKYILKRFRKGHELWFGYKKGIKEKDRKGVKAEKQSKKHSEKKSELVGYITMKPFFPGHKHCEVYWLAVKKKEQGQGIGSELLRFIEAVAKKKGFRKVCLYTGKNMKLAQKFYKKNKYKKLNEFPGYYGYSKGNTTAALFVKEL